MGLFGWLFGAREPERVTVCDRVRQTADARTRAIVKELAEHVDAGSVLLLAHFPSTLASLAPELLDAKLPHEPISERFTPRSALQRVSDPAPRVLFGLVRNLEPDEFPADDPPESPLAVVVAERHFLRRHDERVPEFAEGLGRAPR